MVILSYGDKDPVTLSATLTTQYKRISSYIAGNKLVINDDKTHLIVMGTKATAARRYEVTLEAIGWSHVCEDLNWKEHLQDNEQSLVRQLTSRINGLSRSQAVLPSLPDLWLQMESFSKNFAT